MAKCFVKDIFPVSYHEEYIRISEVYFKQYIEEDRKVEQYRSSIDQQFISIINRREACFISILFEALAIEAFINFYGVLYFGNDFNDIEQLPTINKYKTFIKLITGKEIPNHILSKLIQLKNVRNKMVHVKSSVLKSGMKIEDTLLELKQVFGTKKESVDQLYIKLHGTCLEVIEYISSITDDPKEALFIRNSVKHLRKAMGDTKEG